PVALRARFWAGLGRPAFWLILGVFIVLPCAAFLLLAVSPRLFDQGPQWFTLTYLRQSLTGATAVAVVNSPSWLPSLGWERLGQQDGGMYRLGGRGAGGGPPVIGAG